MTELCQRIMQHRCRGNINDSNEYEAMRFFFLIAKYFCVIILLFKSEKNEIKQYMPSSMTLSVVAWIGNHLIYIDNSLEWR